MDEVVLAGSSGLVGNALFAALQARGIAVRRLVRSQPRLPDEVRWDPAAGQIPTSVFARARAVVNLGGAGIADRRWSPSRRREIVDSRVVPTRLLAETCAREGVPVLLNASATGFFGDRGDESLDEASAAGKGFLASTCVQWEDALHPAREAGVRTVSLRLGVVLSRRGGALERMLPPFRLGLGGPLGTGRQWMPWIHLDDAVGAFLHALEQPRLSGPVLVVAPQPVRQREFARALGRSLRRPAVLPAPGWALRLLLGPMAQELLVAGQRCFPRRLQADGFGWHHPDLAEALQELVAPA